LRISDQITTTAAKAMPALMGVKSAPKTVLRNLKRSSEEVGNLPSYFFGARTESSEESFVQKDAFVVVPEKQMGALLPGLRAGDILQAVLEQAIKASPSVPTPIRARVSAGRFRGVFLLGTATLDRELKRVLLSFERLRIQGSELSYQLKATGLGQSGQVGLEGEHHTSEGAYFAAELGAATIAGYADATTTKSQNWLGSYQAEPNPANAVKQGVAQSLSRTAERFAERARQAPEYTEIDAGQSIQIIIQESPTEVSGG
jgi:hypothetical protein